MSFFFMSIEYLFIFNFEDNWKDVIIILILFNNNNNNLNTYEKKIGLKSISSFICLSSFIIDAKFPECLLILLDLLIDSMVWLIYGFLFFNW